MKKIKLILLLSITLFISLIITTQNIEENKTSNNNLQNMINKQKSLTQEIAKEVLYIHKNKHISTEKLDKSTELFFKNIDNFDSLSINKQSNKFYQNILKFKKQIHSNALYDSIILEKIINNIYNLDINLMVEFDKLSKDNQKACSLKSFVYQNIKYGLFLILFLIFLYLARYILKSSSNFEILVKKINNSIKSINQIEGNVEKYLKEINIDTKDEDIIIQTLEELLKSKINLQQLQLLLRQS